MPSDARTALQEEGAVYLEDVRNGEELLVVADELGETIEPGVGMAAGMHDGRMYSVEVRRGGSGVVDEHGHMIRSTTHHAFAMHTDGYNRREPPRYVLLLRTDDSADDTASQVADSHVAIPDLDERAREVVSRPIFPSALGRVPLLGRTDGGETQLRFNPDEIEQWSQRSEAVASFDDDVAYAVAGFLRALQAHQETFVIAPGDCLVLDNWRVCHGRSGMRPTSRRVLKRVWVA